MNYALRANFLVRVELPDEDPLLLWLYTLLALTTGTETTMENVHDAWSLWRTRTSPQHPSIVPFIELEGRVQEMDRPYMEAIHRVAKVLANA